MMKKMPYINDEKDTIKIDEQGYFRGRNDKKIP